MTHQIIEAWFYNLKHIYKKLFYFINNLKVFYNTLLLNNLCIQFYFKFKFNYCIDFS